MVRVRGLPRICLKLRYQIICLILFALCIGIFLCPYLVSPFCEIEKLRMEEKIGIHVQRLRTEGGHVKLKQKSSKRQYLPKHHQDTALYQREIQEGFDHIVVKKTMEGAAMNVKAMNKIAFAAAHDIKKAATVMKHANGSRTQNKSINDLTLDKTGEMLNPKSIFKNVTNNYFGRLHPIPWTVLPEKPPYNIHEDVWKLFQRRLTRKEYNLYFKLLRDFIDMMTANDILFFLCGGALLGAYRHHDLIPWDDDIDVYIPVKSVVKLLEGFEPYKDVYEMSTSTDRYKIFNKKSSFSLEDKLYDWRWPFIDINFYDENKTHIWDIAPEYEKDNIFPKDHIFPLHTRPFGGVTVPVPHRPHAVLKVTYTVNKCSTMKYSHKFEVSLQSSATLNCGVFLNFYPSVLRSKEKNGRTKEVLRIGSKPIYSISVPENLVVR